MAGPVRAARARAERREDLVDRIWRLFADPRLTLALASVLATAAVAGAVVGPADPAPSWLARALELHDPLHSWWYLLLLVALGLSAVACAIERLPWIALAFARPEAKLTDDLARGLRRVERIPAGPDVAAETARVAAAFRARGYEPETVNAGRARFLFAQRGVHARLGEGLVWLSLLGLAAAGVAGVALDWQGTVEVPEGGAFGAVPVVTAGGDAIPKRLPFALRVNRLDARPGGAGPSRAPRADVSVLDERGRERRREILDSGRPLREAGVEVRAVGYREAPDGSRAAVTVADRQGGERRDVEVLPGEAIQLPGVSYTVESYTPAFGELGPAVQVRRAEGGRSTQFWVFQRRPAFDAENRPDRYALEFRGLRGGYVGLLRLVHRPAAPALALGGLLLAAGLAWTFSTAHRRLWARVEPGAIVIAGESHRPSARFDGTMDGLRAALAATPEGEG